MHLIPYSSSFFALENSVQATYISTVKNGPVFVKEKTVYGLVVQHKPFRTGNGMGCRRQHQAENQITHLNPLFYR